MAYEPKHDGTYKVYENKSSGGCPNATLGKEALEKVGASPGDYIVVDVLDDGEMQVRVMKGECKYCGELLGSGYICDDCDSVDGWD